MKKALHIVLNAALGLIAVMIMMAVMGMTEVHAMTIYDGYQDGKIEFNDYLSEGTYIDFSYVVSSELDLDIKSSDESVLKIYRGNDFDQMDVSHYSSDYWYGMPVGPGSCTVTITNKDDTSDKWTATVTVKPEFFQDVLDNSYGYGPVASTYDADDTPPYFEYTNEVGYGDKKIIVCAPYGALATLYVNGDYICMDEAGVSSRIDLSADFLKKLNTPVKVKIEWVNATKEYNLKIVSKSSVVGAKIKKNSRKAKVTVKKVHKGDYLKIKVGKKFVKTVKIKKDAKRQTISWTNKKKMKKGTKVSYYLYNKYKQKLATAKKVVGK